MAGAAGAMRPQSFSVHESSIPHPFVSLQFDPIELLTSPFNCDLEDLTVFKTETERQPTTASEFSGHADEKSSTSMFLPNPVPAQAFQGLWNNESDEHNTSLQRTAHDKVVVNVGFKPVRSPATSTRGASLSQGSGSKFRRTCSDSSLEMFCRTSSDSSLDTRSSSPGNMFEVAELSEGFSRTMSLPTPGPSMFHDALPEAAGSSAKNRFKLTAEQAIHIFTHKINKTARTASLLSVKYGISPKAIRDIWTLKSWAQETRPFWTRLDEQQSTTPAPARFTNRQG